MPYIFAVILGFHQNVDLWAVLCKGITSIVCIIMGGGNVEKQVLINACEGCLTPLCPSELIWKWRFKLEIPSALPGFELTSDVLGSDVRPLSARLCLTETGWQDSRQHLCWASSEAQVRGETGSPFPKCSPGRVLGLTPSNLSWNQAIAVASRTVRADCVRPGSRAPPLDSGSWRPNQTPQVEKGVPPNQKGPVTERGR